MASRTSDGNAPGPPRTPPLSSLSSLTRQASIYSLTLQELQNAVNEPGKSFGSMNMEEFLKNIWTVEESQAMAAAMSGVGEGNGLSSGITHQASLQRQGSLSLPRNLAGKTVDEVWKEIHRSNDRSAGNNLEQRQMTMGETTLEDFLAKVGVVRDETEEGPSANSSSSIVTHVLGKMEAAGMQATSAQASRQAAPQQVDWINYQQLLMQQHQQHQQHQLEAATTGFAGNLVAGLPASNVLDASLDAQGVLGPSPLSLSPVMMTPDTPTRSKKRPLEIHEERSLEQRQKRMIKNRESAARSRARKQAYTVELEAQVTELKEENAKLKQEQIEARKKRRKWLDATLVPVTSQPQRPVCVLRRTQTCFW